MVFLSLTTSRVLAESDMISTLHIFRRVTEFTKDIIFSRNSEPDLEPKLIVVSLLTIRNSRDENVASVNEGFLSNLALHFPFITSLMGRDTQELKQAWSNHSFRQPPGSAFSVEDQGLSKLFSVSTDATVSNLCSDEIETIKTERESNNNNGKIQPEFEEATFESDGDTSIDVGRENLSSQQERNFWSNTPAFAIAQLWAKERTTTGRRNQRNELDSITLPVGVKSLEVQYDHSPNTQPETRMATDSTFLSSGHAASAASLSGVGLEKVIEICSSAAAFLKGKMNKSRKRGSAASRAASMLDAERELEKTWSPIVEIQFGEGTYRGRCQEGVPEGKGRLTYSDGSIYDGLWRYGKRSGLGTLYYSNGDVFHGTWRDDLIHGKGWYYFHSGDRWFANFWKGKASGEGRFYAKDGSILFGHFQNGWRHGECLLIDGHGSRWLEVWDDGVLTGRTKLEE